MTSIKEPLKKALVTIRGNRVLDAGAKGLLAEIPIVGNFLVNLYEDSVEGDEKKIYQVIKVLENLQKFNDQQFEDLKNTINENWQQLKKNTESLSLLVSITTKIATKLNEIYSLMGELKNQQSLGFEQVKKTIKDSENNLKEFMKLHLSTTRYDISVTGDLLRFYLVLQQFLNKQGKIFQKQIGFANELLDKFNDNETKEAQNGKMGRDYALSGLHRKMNEEQLRKFDYIREITEQMREFNSYARDLLIHNKEFFNDIPELRELYNHYSWWEAKYELLKDNNEMAIIYTGPDQKKPFPKKIEELIKNRVEALKKETLMGNDNS